MQDETTIIAKSDETPKTVGTVETTTKIETTQQGQFQSDSSFLSVSVRAWLAIMLTLTICIMSLAGSVVQEPLYGLGYLAIGFFFGQKTKGV